jgi:hypothetical protein
MNNIPRASCCRLLDQRWPQAAGRCGTMNYLQPHAWIIWAYGDRAGQKLNLGYKLFMARLSTWFRCWRLHLALSSLRGTFLWDPRSTTPRSTHSWVSAVWLLAHWHGLRSALPVHPLISFRLAPPRTGALFILVAHDLLSYPVIKLRCGLPLYERNAPSSVLPE